MQILMAGNFVRGYLVKGVKAFKFMLYSKFKFSSFLYDYNIVLKSRLTLVTNESGGGKTLLYKALKDYALVNHCHNIFFYDCYTKAGDLDLFRPETLVVIDNAPILISDILALQIAMNENTQYLIFTQDADVYKYKPVFSNLAELITQGDTVKLKYVM